MAKCTAVDCEQSATYRAQFHLYAPIGDTPALAMTPILACKNHATEAAGRELLNDNEKGRAQIEALFDENGLMSPDWNRSYTKWVEVL